MPDDLIGYLMDALEPHEMRFMDHRLENDPELRKELQRLRTQLTPLDNLAGPCDDLPPRLSRRTMAVIGATDPSNIDESAETETVDGETVEAETVEAETVEPLAVPTGPQPLKLDASGSPDLSSHSGRHGLGGHGFGSRAVGGRRSPLNWLTAAVAASIVIAMLAPALLRWRESSRRQVCVDQMRQMGTALTQFVTRNEQRRLPGIATSGPESFAGIYAVRLSDSGLLTNRSLRWCPTLDVPASDQFRFINPLDIATATELMDSDVNRLKEIQQTSGGHYAYTLGVVDREHYQSPKFESRSSFAVLADLPQTAVVSDGNYQVASGHGDGINVLYEDGSVSFVSLLALDSLPDHPLRNHRGDREAGITVDDASLAPSWQPPFLDSRQR